MMAVILTQESVISAFCMRIPGVYRYQVKFSYIFVINCHFSGHFVKIRFLIFIFCHKLSVFN